MTEHQELAQPKHVHDEAELVASIRDSKSSESVVQTTLRTDQRVIARVTDGIYRQPGSAIRELISNAYDADATRVVITSDPPRFDRISVEDNGHGMAPEALAHLLLHIGGSAKRSDLGPSLGITAENNAMCSPNGRRLIGKIGIGLFSVSQLTHKFQIITKVRNDPFRTIATVVLRQYADDDFPETGDSHKTFESGRVNIWREKASDVGSHGTTIILTSIRPQARDTLRSRDLWSAIEQSESLDQGVQPIIEPPKFHIGRIDSSEKLMEKFSNRFDSLPWKPSDSPSEAFHQLVNAVWNEVNVGNPNPRLDQLFDFYLRMVWQLSLAVPLAYVDGHPFDLDFSEDAEVFRLSNIPKGNPEYIALNDPEPIREKLGLTDSTSSIGIFDVYFDELKLFRPIRFRKLPTTNHALKKPLLFFGKCRETFPKIQRELSGGNLAFEAYLLWTPKVAPTEHQGSLIRIHGSSGTLFDPTFMRYQVSEQTRLRQITCEIFVSEGLDSALNIDRESFNNAHPHSVYITRWLHSALRQLASAQKRLAGEVRNQQRDSVIGTQLNDIQEVALSTWKEESDDLSSNPPSVELMELDGEGYVHSDSYRFSRSAIVGAVESRKTVSAKHHQEILEEKLKAIAQVLASFGLLDTVPKRKQERMLRAIFKILKSSSETK